MAGLWARLLAPWRKPSPEAAPASVSPVVVPPVDSGVADYLKWLKTCRDNLVAESYKAEAAYDRTVILLAGGGLAISVTFLKEVAPQPDPATLKYLWASWLMFVLSLMAILVSMLTSQLAFEREIDATHRQYTRATGGDYTPVAERRTSAYVTLLLNWASGVCFLAGAGAFLFFGAFNTQGAPTGEERKEGSQAHDTQGRREETHNQRQSSQAGPGSGGEAAPASTVAAGADYPTATIEEGGSMPKNVDTTPTNVTTTTDIPQMQGGVRPKPAPPAPPLKPPSK